MTNRRSFIRKAALLVASAFSFTSIAKAFGLRTTQGRNVVVTLYVHTASIQKPDESSYCNFGQPDDVSNEDFATEISLGDTVTWQGVSLDSTADVVDIVAINYQGGKNVFGRNVIRSSSKSPQKVIAQPTVQTEAEESCKYNIQFTVSNGGKKRNGMFQIDPVIQVH